MNATDWNAPLNADGRERPLALRAALGLETPVLETFLGELEDEISADAWGFERLGDLADEDQRCLVSDQMLSAAYGLQDALVDASISLREVEEYTGPNGLPYSSRNDSLNDMLRYVRLRRSVAAHFDAVGTALDCLAALLVVVARAPLSVQRADFRSLQNLDPDGRHRGAFEDEIPNTQRDLWRSLLEELANGFSIGPDGWLDWSLEMRNALTHRGRVTNIYMPRTISARLAVPTTAEPQALLRYDLHLRRRPWLPEIEGMLAGDELPDSWLDEPASKTIRGLHDALVNYVEGLLGWARHHWAHPGGDLVAPAQKWVLPTAPEIDFAGIDPGGTTPIQGAIGGINQEHMRLAERLRVRRLAQQEGADEPG